MAQRDSESSGTDHVANCTINFSAILGIVRNRLLVLLVSSVSEDNYGTDTLADGFINLADGTSGDGSPLTVSPSGELCVRTLCGGIC